MPLDHPADQRLLSDLSVSYLLSDVSVIAPNAADKLAGHIAALTEENRRLREDNERLREEPYFICPNCGGTHFGRRTEKGPDGLVVFLDDVRCHDEHGKGCKWSGVWPRSKAGVERDPARAGGKPVIAGTRITVGQLLCEIASGMSVATFADEFDIPVDTVRAALHEVANELNGGPPREMPVSGETKILCLTPEEFDTLAERVVAKMLEVRLFPVVVANGYAASVVEAPDGSGE